jgi:hypothetical protein
LVFGLIFKVAEWDPKIGEGTIKVGGTSNSSITNSNSITIEEVVDQNLVSKGKGPMTLDDLGPFEPSPL